MHTEIEDPIEFLKEHFEAEYLIYITGDKKRRTYKDVCAMHTPDSVFVLHKDNSISIIPIFRVVEVKMKREPSLYTCKMLVEYFIASHPRVFAPSDPSNEDVR